MFNYSTSMKRSERMSLPLKLINFNWKLVLFIFLICLIGIAVLYSAGKSECNTNINCFVNYGSWYPWAISQVPKIILGFLLMFIVGVIDLRIWIRYAYILHGAAILLLIAVMLFGHVGMGAQRWLNIGIIKLQPSEIVKITLVLSLAKYFSSLSINEIQNNYYLLFPLFLILLPVGLVLKQPDLGTAMSLLFISFFIFFIVGVQKWKFIVVFLIGLLSFPIIWKYGLHDYQKQRIIIFLNPEKDIMGTGYHITQSKISLGSGGFTGKGYLKGTQSHLNFLPEKQTDFIFTMYAEEFGFVGSIFLFILIISVIFQSYKVAFSSRNNFGKLLSFGLASNFFIYFFINTAMVIGLIPVVGVPSPFLSYGGTAIITLLFGFGLVQSSYVHGDMIISSKADYL